MLMLGHRRAMRRIFSIYNGLFLRALPFAESDRLVDWMKPRPTGI